LVGTRREKVKKRLKKRGLLLFKVINALLVITPPDCYCVPFLFHNDGIIQVCVVPVPPTPDERGFNF
jgi:hypothetical protein